MEEMLIIVAVVVGGVIALGLLALYIASIIWAFADGEARGKSGCLVALLVAVLSWPVGLLVWLVFRPDKRQ